MRYLTNLRTQTPGWIAVATAFAIPLSTSLTSILFILNALLFFLTGNWTEKFQAIYHRRAIYMMLVLFLWMVIGLTYTTVSLPEALGTLSKYDKLLLGVFFVPIFKEEKWRRLALHAFFAAIIVTLLAALFTEVGLLHASEKFGRFLVFKDRIQTSFIMAMGVYFLGVCFFETTNPSLKKLYAGLLVISTIFLFSTDGRSGYVIFFALFLWLLWGKWRWKGVLIALGISIGIIIAAYFLSSAFNARVQESVHDTQVYQTGKKETSLGFRFEFVKNSLELIKKHPIFGTGTGSFITEYAKLNMPDILKTKNPHNQYLHILVQWGVVGLLILFWLFFVQFKDSYLLPPLLRQIAQGTLFAIAIGSLANSWLLDTTEGHFYVYFIALAFARERIYTTDNFTSILPRVALE